MIIIFDDEIDKLLEDDMKQYRLQRINEAMKHQTNPCPISQHLDDLFADGWIDEDLNQKDEF